MIQTILPKSQQEWLELRTHNINSTEGGALFGIQSASYIPTLFELWHRKHDNIAVEFEPNDRVKWGMRLQDTIAEGIAEDQGWQVRRMDEYIHDTDMRIGASFDFSIESGYGESVAKGLLEIKNVDSLVYKQGWLIDGDNVEAPPHIELQVQWQLLVSGRAFAYIAALIGGNWVVLIKRLPDLEIHDAIKRKAAEFWKSIDENRPPKPDFTRDAAFVTRLHSYAEVGKCFDASSDMEIITLAKRHKELGEAVKQCEAERDGIKAQILTKIGDSEKVVGDGFSISAGLVGPSHVEYDRSGYRLFKINWQRGKK